MNTIDWAEISDLETWWRNNAASLLDGDRGQFWQFVSYLKRRGDPFLGYEVCEDALADARVKDEPATVVRLREEQSLFLARTGSLDTAEALLLETISEYGESLELLCRLGRIRKQRWRLDGNRENLAAAYRWYSRAFENFGGHYAAINAAGLALQLDQPDEAGRLAKEALRVSRADQVVEPADFWAIASEADALLILGRQREAGTRYRTFLDQVGSDFDTVATTVRQARELAEKLGIRLGDIAEFRIPSVAVFTGHRIDNPDRETPRFPAAAKDTVTEAIGRWIRDNKVAVGYCSAASGGDIIFAEQLLAHGADCRIVLPFEAESFRRVSVEVPGDESWERRFDALMIRAHEVIVLLDQPVDAATANASIFDYADQMIIGYARLRSDPIAEPVRGLALWERGDRNRGGERGSCIGRWKSGGVEIAIVDPLTGALDCRPSFDQAHNSSMPSAIVIPTGRPAFHQEVRAVLFADFVGYSRLHEADIPNFLEFVMTPLAAKIDSLGMDVIEANTWGDALYLVFREPRDAGRAAIELRASLDRMTWKPQTQSGKLCLRMSLHAGPLFEAYDPFRKRVGYTGTHSSIGARVEPVTPEGQIYASDAYAALCANEPNLGFRFEYVGNRELHKGYGVRRLFLVVAE